MTSNFHKGGSSNLMHANPLVNLQLARMQQGLRSMTEASVLPRGINVCLFFLLFSFALFCLV